MQSPLQSLPQLKKRPAFQEIEPRLLEAVVGGGGADVPPLPTPDDKKIPGT